MNNDKPSRGFTTAILHSDRDAGIEHGALHKPLHVSVAYGYRDARDLAAVFQGRAPGYAYGRQGNPTTAALEAKVTKMEDGVATVCFATGMAAIGAMMLSLLREGDHVVSSQFLFGNTVSQFGTLAAHGANITFVDATDVANVRARADPGDEAHLRRDDRQPAHAGRGPRAHRGACAAARHPLRRRQHDDLACAVPSQDGRRRARDQRADQVHRRPRQRARRQHHRHRPLRLDALSQHRRELQVAAAGAVGHPADPEEGPARLGRRRFRRPTRTTSPSAPRRSRCAWSARAPTHWRSRSFSRRTRACAMSTTPACRRMRSMRSRARCSAPTADSSRSSSRTASTASTS